MQNNEKKSKQAKIEIYHGSKNEVRLKVRLEKEMIWLSLSQIANLFNTDKSGISRHIKNIYQDGELSEKQTVAKIATVQKEGQKRIKRNIRYYNLDMVISVGYRVNSQKATHFRIWATNVLKKHLVKGFTFNKKRLQEKGLKEFEQTVKLIKDTIDNRKLTDQETRGLLTVVTDYTNSWLLLDKYDSDSLPYEIGSEVVKTLSYKECAEAIEKMKENLYPDDIAMINIFGQELGGYALEPVIDNLNQTFDSKPLYPGIKEKAAHLLYFIIKDHPFLEGNKRIGSFLFLLFLAKNNYLYREDGSRRIDSYTLVALALLIAESNSKQKDILVRLVMNFLT